jgi:predicted acyltransferase (DUF342 family)
MSTNSWKQYGGTRKQEKFHNLTIGTLVADKVLLRDSYAGKYIIAGTLYVGADLNTGGNINAALNVNSAFDAYIGQSAYVNSKLYFATQTNQISLSTKYAFINGTSDGTSIGINTTTPTNVVDIMAVNSQQTNVLSVRSLNNSIQNILGHNVNNKGLVMNAQDTAMALNFYVDTANNGASNPDAQILQQAGGLMSYLAKSNTITSTIGPTNISSANGIYITSSTLLSITAPQSVTISTTRTTLLSTLGLSNRISPSPLFNETAIIYDISSGLYLYEAYENTNAFSGSALTLVTKDTSSNTYLRITTPSKNGLLIGGGAYPNDQIRTLATIGLQDVNGNYKTNQTIVSGTSKTNYYSTIGINTYAPKTELYIMDINGATRIGNGEINNMRTLDFEILRASFSKIVTSYGIQVGSPSTPVYSPTKRVTVYPQYITYTVDGGVTWNLSRVDTSSDLETTSRSLNVYTYDNNYAVIGSSNNFFYYTLNGGIKWNPFALSDPFGNVRIRTTVCLYIGEFNGSTKRVFITYTLGASPTMYIVYFNLNFTILPVSTGGTYFISSSLHTTLTPSIRTIYHNDGYGDLVYFVGTGINQYQISSATSNYLINTNYTYYNIACYNNSYAIAVGNNIISYTKDGTNWTDIVLSNTSVGNVVLRSVSILSLTQAVAVGDGGIFIYTTNGSITWNIVPNSILNTSGYAGRINNSNNMLRSIFINNLDTMIISSVKLPYSLTQSGSQIIQVSGITKIYNCYLPNLFNRANNNVLDVSGNSTHSGDININDGGNLITNNSTFNLINTTAQTVNFAGNASTINIGNPRVTGMTTICTQADISGNTLIRSNLQVANNIVTGGNITTSAALNVAGDLSMNGRIFVGDDSVFGGNLTVRGNLIIDMNYIFTANLTVDRTAYFEQDLHILRDTSMVGNLYVNNTSVFNKDVSMISRLCVGNDVSFQKNISVAGTILANSDISLNANMRFYTSRSRMTINSDNINVYDGSRANIDVSTSKLVFIKNVTRDVQAVMEDTTRRTKYIQSDTNDANTMMQLNKNSGDILIYGNLVPAPGYQLALGSPTSFFKTMYVSTRTIYFSDGAQPAAAMSFNNTTGGIDITSNNSTGSSVLSYDGNVAIGKQYPDTTLDVVGTSTFNGDINQVTGNLLTNGTFTVGSDTNLGGNVLINGYVIQSGQFLLNSNLTVNGTSIMNGRARITGDLSLGTRLFIANDVSANRNMFISGSTVQNGDVSMNSRLSIASDLSVNGGLLIRNKATFNTDVSMGRNLTVSGGLFARGDISFNSRVFIGSDLSLGGNIASIGTCTVQGDSLLQSRLFVFDIANLGSDVFINGQTIMNNDVSLNNAIRIGKDASINGNLFVHGKTTKLDTDVSINGNITINGTSLLNGLTKIEGYTTIQGDLSANNGLTVRERSYFGDDVSMNKNIFIGGNALINGDIAVYGNRTTFDTDVSINGRLTVSQTMTNLNNVTMNSRLNVNGILTTNDISTNGQLIVRNNIIANSNLFVSGRTVVTSDASFQNGLQIGRDATITGRTNAIGGLTSQSDTTLNGALSVQGDTTLNGSTTMNGPLSSNGDMILNGSLIANTTATFNRNLIVAGDLSVNGNILFSRFGDSTIPISAIIGGAGLATGGFNNDVNVARNFYVGGDTILYGNLTVIKNMTLIGMLSIQQYKVNQTITTVSYQIMIAEDLSLAGRLYMTGDASINGRVFVGGDVSLNSNLYVDDYSIFNNNVTMNNDLLVNGNFNLGGSTILNGYTTFNNDVSINGNLAIGGQKSIFVNDISVNRRLSVLGDSSFNGRLFIFGRTTNISDVSMNNRLFVNGDTSLNARLYVSQISTFMNDVSINNCLYVNNDATFLSNTYVSNQSTFGGPVTINNNLFLQNDASFTGKLYVKKTALFDDQVRFNNRLFILGDVSVNAKLYVDNYTTLNLDVSMNNRLYLAGDASFSRKLYVRNNTILNGDVSLNSRLYVDGDASFTNRLYVGGRSLFDRDISVNGNVLCTNLILTGNIVIKQAFGFDSLLVKKNTNLQGDVYIQGNTQMIDTSINGNLMVSNDISLNRSLYVGKDTSLNGNLTVIGLTQQLSDVSMIAGLDLNGSMLARSNINVLGIINQYTTGTNQDTIVNMPSYITSNASQITLGSSPSQTVKVQSDMYVNGNVGIGTTTPTCPLYVNTYATSTSQNSGYFLSSGSSGTSAIGVNTPYNYSIYAVNSIATADKLIATTMVNFSDKRIKTNIEAIDSAASLETIRHLQPKKFEYIDTILQGSQPTWGFIAQEVHPVLQYSVSMSKNYIPNIFELAVVMNGNKLLLKNKSATDITLYSRDTKLKLFTIQSKEIIVTIFKIIDDKTIWIHEHIKSEDLLDGEIFVYGQEIDDFHNLDKSTIFTITTSALQQVDKELQEAKQTIREQNCRIVTLEEQIQKINERLEIQ